MGRGKDLVYKCEWPWSISICHSRSWSLRILGRSGAAKVAVKTGFSTWPGRSYGTHIDISSGNQSFGPSDSTPSLKKSPSLGVQYPLPQRSDSRDSPLSHGKIPVARFGLWPGNYGHEVEETGKRSLLSRQFER